MVELSTDDFKTIFRWFELAHGKLKPSDIPLDDKRVFWKLTFLTEDRIAEEKLAKSDD